MFNFELPMEPESYVHRIGRTARAGSAGVAVSFCDGEEIPRLRAIERTIRQPVPVDEDHPYHADGIAGLPSLLEVASRRAAARRALAERMDSARGSGPANVPARNAPRVAAAMARRSFAAKAGRATRAAWPR